MLPFAPSVSTVGVLAQSLPVLRKAIRVLLRSQEVALPAVKNVYLLREAFALSDAAIEHALSECIACLRNSSDITVTTVSHSDIQAFHRIWSTSRAKLVNLPYARRKS